MTADELIYGYSNGIFPMAESATGEIYWYAPDPRAIIPLHTYKPSKSLRPLINKSFFEVRFNTCFEDVIRSCANPRFVGDETWISEEIITAYQALHKSGFAHSVEVFLDDKLVGGLYGVALGAVFFGESMFHSVPNASKIAFHNLIETLKKQGFLLLDTQFINDNVKRFGAIEVSKEQFMKLLYEGLAQKAIFIESDVVHLFKDS